MQDRILIVDFGSQLTQLIARRVREAGVYSEIVPYQSAAKALDWPGLKGVILSRGPASVREHLSPPASAVAFRTNNKKCPAGEGGGLKIPTRRPRARREHPGASAQSMREAVPTALVTSFASAP